VEGENRFVEGENYGKLHSCQLLEDYYGLLEGENDGDIHSCQLFEVENQLLEDYFLVLL